MTQITGNVDKKVFHQLRTPDVRKRFGGLIISRVDKVDFEFAKFAFSISSKVAKAVRRNKLRRQLKAILSQPEIVFPTAAYLIIARKQAFEESFLELQHDLATAASYFMNRDKHNNDKQSLVY